MNYTDLDAATTSVDRLPVLDVRTWYVDGVSPHAPAPFDTGLPTTPAEFLSLLPVSGTSCWVRGSSGLVGFDRVLRLRARGARRFDTLSRTWSALAARARVSDEVDHLGSGLIGFSTLAFSAHSTTDSVVDVPRFLLGRRDGRVWLTSITMAEPGAHGAASEGQGASGAECASAAESNAVPPLSRSPLTPVCGARVESGEVGPEDFVRIVGEAATRMRAEQDDPDEPLRKVVLARDEVVQAPEDIDVRAVLGALNAAYPSTWTFDVAGLIGATPELLVGVEDGRVTSRVLAGTYRVQEDPAAELGAARAQLGGAKDTTEHRFAIDSLAASLGAVSADLHVDEQPHLLQLRNVIHLASDAAGTLDARADGSALTAIDVAAAVHPTAAVGGFPKEKALAAIEALEAADRGRYAGPVGWVDGRGNGQFGIALRCGQLEAPDRIRLWAGAGIMPDSDPESELAETEAKLAPMKRALGL
ncbi:isochorismate synthase [Brevibacterium litoralis]|uniref:isochorismate synthase n=1 Tax=Brevibacterium litoralis TaxID=3138935 RepID=UPI0032EDD20F